MKRMVSWLLIGALGATGLATAAPAPTPTLDELVAKNAQARGGIAALHAMRSLSFRGKLLVNDGQIELGFLQTVQRPADIRVEASIQGMTQIQAYNGTIGWQINPFQGRKDPERLSTDDTKSLAETVADFDGALIDAQQKGNKLEYLGTEDVDGTQAYKIKLTRPGGDTEYVYLDPDHYLEIRLLSQRTEHGVTIENVTDLGDYEKVQGVFVPFSIEFGRKGSSDRQKLIVSSAKINAATDAASFNLPATPAKPAGNGT
jgi:hypothetical protein